jgi:hypothetical protein
MIRGFIGHTHPWTLRAPDQLGRYLRPSVGLVLGGQNSILGENLCARQKEFIARMFSNGLFLRLKKPVPRDLENQIISQAGGRVK